MSGAVFDASALLAMAFSEPGADLAVAYLIGGRVSAVNFSEAGAKLIDKGLGAEEAFHLLGALGLDVVPFDAASAQPAAALRVQSRAFGLSFADRACLGLAIERQAPAITADKVWSRLDLPCAIVQLR
jgi:PIN domain nuclease of toxin-antitoxin system